VDDNSEHEWKVFCYDKNSGKILWERTSCKGIPMIKRHPKSTHANSSAATDGKYVVASLALKDSTAMILTVFLNGRRTSGFLNLFFQ
jgi:outer membrane protein assembly factor BamB